MLIPSYILDCLKKIEWIKSDDTNITFYPDDLMFILYGARGSTAFSGPDHIRYGSNTTAYQIWSPKLPVNMLYLGDGGSGILEISNIVLKKLFARGINPFTADAKKVAPVIAGINNTYTHCHYDHLHMGTPLAGIFHANSITKNIIGDTNIKTHFTKAFKRPVFPRDFGEIQACYHFQSIKEPRASVLIFTPDGEFKVMGSSTFDSFLTTTNPQVKHKNVFFNLEDCLIVRCAVADHPDPCISFRYENYNSSGELLNAIVFMTDHEIRESDDFNSYFVKHVDNCNAIYLDGQYETKNYVPGFGHGRVEIIGRIMAKLNINNILIGHHDPQWTDKQIDEMITLARKYYEENLREGNTGPSRLVGAADRMMLFIPGRERQRKGVVFGRMNCDRGYEIKDEIGSQSTVISEYKSFDLTQVYRIEDFTIEDEKKELY